MKKIICMMLTLLLLLCGCSMQKEKDMVEDMLTPENGAEDFSLSTSLPDGRERIEARVLQIVDDTTYRVMTQNGEQTLTLSEQVAQNAKLLGVAENSKIIVTMMEGSAESIELVTAE